MEITAKECIAWILERAPAFRRAREGELEWRGDDNPGLGKSVAAFSRYVVEATNG
jgi:hypothetical protein